MALAVKEAGGTPSIAEVRQVFVGQRSIVDKHWAGALNAPENWPFDEGLERPKPSPRRHTSWPGSSTQR